MLLMYTVNLAWLYYTTRKPSSLMLSIFQIRISQNTKCAEIESFPTYFILLVILWLLTVIEAYKHQYCKSLVKPSTFRNILYVANFM